MTLPTATEPPPLTDTGDGVIRIANTRIPLERVIGAFVNGATPEQIVMDYDVLALEDVYAVINHYLHHRTEVQAYLTTGKANEAEIRSELESISDSAGLRERLLARRASKTKRT